MEDPNLSDLIEHLQRNMALDNAEAEKLIREVLAYFQESQESFVRRRHLELQARGYANKEIFLTIQSELQARVFPGNKFTERQIRRIIYG